MQGVQRLLLLRMLRLTLAASPFAVSCCESAAVHFPVMTSSGVAPLSAECGILVFVSLTKNATPFSSASMLVSGMLKR